MSPHSEGQWCTHRRRNLLDTARLEQLFDARLFCRRQELGQQCSLKHAPDVKIPGKAGEPPRYAKQSARPQATHTQRAISRSHARAVSPRETQQRVDMGVQASGAEQKRSLFRAVHRLRGNWEEHVRVLRREPIAQRSSPRRGADYTEGRVSRREIWARLRG
jgi:hypothetical protein